MKFTSYVYFKDSLENLFMILNRGLFIPSLADLYGDITAADILQNAVFVNSSRPDGHQ